MLKRSEPIIEPWGTPKKYFLPYGIFVINFNALFPPY